MRLGDKRLAKAEVTYLRTVRDQLYKIGDKLLLEDSDLLCEYIVLRFLKTSTAVHSAASPQDAVGALQEFVKNIYPILVTFITIANSLPLAEGQVGDA